MTTATEVRTPPHHDTLTCYKDYNCRLPACRERNRRWNSNYRAQTAEGTWQPFADATPVRIHIHGLYAAGFTDYRIANLAQTTPPTIHSLGKRSYAKGRGQQQRISQPLADRILAISPDTDLPGRVPAIGTQRRIRALVAGGWPQLYIAREAGIGHKNIYHLFREKNVNASTASAIKDAYERLADQKPERNGISRASAKRASAHARRNRWAPVAYWADPAHPIDDVHFRSEYEAPAAQIIAEEARWLMEHAGLTQEQVAKRLGRSHSYIKDALREHPEQDEQVAA